MNLGQKRLAAWGLGVLTGGVLLVAQSAVSFAQVNVPSTADPNHLQNRLDESIEPRAEQDGISVDRQEDGVVPSGADEVKFALNGVIVEGATIYGEADFLPLYEDLLGQDISLTQVYEIARKITLQYSNDGYILSQAVIPAQEIDGGGIVRIQVIEGFVDRVLIEGEGLSDSEIAQLEALGAKIQAQRPLHVATLERYLLLAEDMPGASVRGVLRPSETMPGAADIHFVTEHSSFGGYLNLNNRGTEFIGPLQIIGSVDYNSPLGLYDHLNATLFMTPDFEELRSAGLTYDFPVGTEGTRASFAGNYTLSHPGASLLASDVDGDIRSFSASLTHPFIRSRRQNLSGGVTFDTYDSVTTTFGSELSEDRLRSLRLTGSYDFADTFLSPAATFVSLEFSQGLEIFGASDDASDTHSRTRGRSDYTKFVLDVNRIQQIFGGMSVSLTASGQKAFTRLLAAEEFSIGGSRFGGAYDPAEITGDDGVAAKAELRWGEELGLSFLQNYQLFGYYDLGKTFDRDPQGTDEADRALASAGLGVRGNATSYLSFGLEVAKPLTRDVSSNTGNPRNERYFFWVTGRF